MRTSIMSMPGGSRRTFIQHIYLQVLNSEASWISPITNNLPFFILAITTQDSVNDINTEMQSLYHNC